MSSLQGSSLLTSVQWHNQSATDWYIYVIFVKVWKGLMSIGWPARTSKSSQKSWREFLGWSKSRHLQLDCCLCDLVPDKQMTYRHTDIEYPYKTCHIIVASLMHFKWILKNGLSKLYRNSIMTAFMHQQTWTLLHNIQTRSNNRE